MRSLADINRFAIEHMQAGTTDLGERITVNPVSSYLDASLFELETNYVLRNRPIPFVASAKLTNAGDYVAKEVCGVPVIAVRTEDKAIHVFLNVCRHRGAQLVPKGEGSSFKGFTCPFHGWSYKANGQSCRNTTHQGLVELKFAESVGMIWILLDSQSEFPLEKSLNAFQMDSPHLGFTPRFSREEFVHIGNFNWKIGVEAFLEVDHFPFAHAPHLANIQFPGLSLTDAFDSENFRIVVPLKRPLINESVLEWSQVMHFIFPSSFLLYYRDHVALLNLLPVGIDKTEFRYTPLVPFERDLEDSTIKKKVDFLKVILQQDFDILEGIQKGLNSKANVHFTFTRSEHVLGSFHRSLDALVKPRS
jgi:phenylpropionate dioxygenase-like ring-hydroxylating dioxygenase large terminal subunit